MCEHKFRIEYEVDYSPKTEDWNEVDKVYIEAVCYRCKKILDATDIEEILNKHFELPDIEKD